MKQKYLVTRWPADVVEGIKILAKQHNRKMTDEMRVIVQRELTAALPELVSSPSALTIAEAQEVDRLTR